MVRKKFIRLLHESGRKAEAQWYEAREIHRATCKDPDLRRKWVEDNPRPENPHAKRWVPPPPRLIDKAVFDPSDDGPDLAYNNDLLKQIRESKEKVKGFITQPDIQREQVLLYQKIMVRLVQEEKRLIYEQNFFKFDEDMFQDLQDRVPTPPFHIEMFDLFQRSRRACVICPRGHAKSTNARKYLLHQILHKKVRYVVIIGASEDLASQNLMWIRDQLAENDKILEVYGHLKNPQKWADTVFATKDGIKVVAKGAGQKIRGQNDRGRPDLVYIDDLEEDEQVSSKDQREKLRNWFTKALLPLISRLGRIIMTGTILDLESLLMGVKKNEIRDHIKWDILFYQAIMTDDRGNERALWPQMWSLDVLRGKRQADPEAFAQEYQNDPASGGMIVFKRELYKYIDDGDVTLSPDRYKVYVKGKLVNLILCKDCALSDDSAADFNVDLVAAMDEDTNMYVIDYLEYRTSDPFEIVENMFLMLEKYPGIDTVTLEKQTLEKVLKRIIEIQEKVKQRPVYIKVLSRYQSQKLLRIKSLRGPLSSGRLLWKPEHRSIEKQMEKTTVTKLPPHDDVLDAMADAWDNLLEARTEMKEKEPEVNSIAWLVKHGLMKSDEQLMQENYERALLR